MLPSGDKLEPYSHCRVEMVPGAIKVGFNSDKICLSLSSPSDWVEARRGAQKRKTLTAMFIVPCPLVVIFLSGGPNYSNEVYFELKLDIVQWDKIIDRWCKFHQFCAGKGIKLQTFIVFHRL